MNTWSKHNFPDDLLSEILCRLPVKSLLRFRCVSRSWCYLIDDPDFCRLHLTRFSNNRLESHLFALQGPDGKPECVVLCSETLITTAKLGFFRTDIPANNVVGSIDGLFMLHNWMCKAASELEFVLWNPSIRKTLAVPASPVFSLEMRNFELGLGFDPSIRDYKYVTVVLTRIGVLRSIAVYTVGSNSWKEIKFQNDDWACRFAYQQRTLFLRGVLYNLAECITPYNNSVSFDLVSFDLRTEVFASTRLPQVPQLQSYSQAVTLTDAGSSLALVYLWGLKGSLWVLESLGGDSNWTQRYTFDMVIPKYDNDNDYDGCPWFSIFLYLKDDMLLLKLMFVVLSYNLETRKEKIMSKENIHQGNTWPYVESLLLLK